MTTGNIDNNCIVISANFVWQFTPYIYYLIKVKIPSAIL